MPAVPLASMNPLLRGTHGLPRNGDDKACQPAARPFTTAQPIQCPTGAMTCPLPPPLHHHTAASGSRPPSRRPVYTLRASWPNPALQSAGEGAPGALR